LFQFILAIHILAAVIFLGNLITTAFWKVRADRSGNLENMAMTSRAVLLADYVFTGPGIAALLVTGILLAGLSGWERFQEPWLGISLMLLLVTAFIWAGVLIPLQLRLVRLSQEGLAAGSLGVMLMDPMALTVGASGAVFGLMAATVVHQLHRGVNPWHTGLGGLVVVNLFFTFGRPGISIGGHLGGLVGGAVLAWLLDACDRRRFPRFAGTSVLYGLVVVFLAAGVWAAGNWTDPLVG